MPAGPELSLQEQARGEQGEGTPALRWNSGQLGSGSAGLRAAGWVSELSFYLLNAQIENPGQSFGARA